MSKKLLSLLFVLLLMVVLAACGSDDEDSSSSSSSVRSTASTSSGANTSAENSAHDEPVLEEATSEQPTGDIQDPIFAFDGADFMPSDKSDGDVVPAGAGTLATGAAGNMKFKADVAGEIPAIDGFGSKHCQSITW